MNETKEKTPENKPEELPLINFRIPSRMPSVVAQHMTINEVNGETVIMFFEVIPPILPSDEEQRAKAQEHLNKTGLIAECVSRVTFSSHRLPVFADALKSIADGYLEDVKQMEENYAKSFKDNSET